MALGSIGQWIKFLYSLWLSDRLRDKIGRIVTLLKCTEKEKQHNSPVTEYSFKTKRHLKQIDENTLNCAG